MNMPTRSERIQHILANIPERYEIRARSGSPWDPSLSAEDQLVGAGGSSIVLRAIYAGKIPRALKVLVPRDDFNVGDTGLGLFARSFDNEANLLSELHHEHIARITDVGTITDETGPGGRLPWVAMELVQGPDLDEWAASEAVDGDQIIEVLDQVLGAIEYLHRHRVLHCDLKNENIKVQYLETGDPPSAVLLDLGVSHVIPVDDTDGEEYTFFYSTPAFAHPSLKYALANRSGNRIRVRDLREFFPRQDLYSLGVLIEHLLAAPDVEAKIRRSVGHGGLLALQTTAQRLRGQVEGHKRYQTATDVRRTVRRLSSRSLAPLGMPILSGTGSKGVSLPGLDRRWIASREVEALVNHPAMQRLRNIPQTDLLHYVFPGATHTRFAHALEEMGLAREAIQQQLHNWKFRVGVDQSDIEDSLYLSLLGSVGRYQLWHMFEDFLSDKKDLESAGLMTVSEVANSLVAAESLGHLESNDLRNARNESIADLLPRDWIGMNRLLDAPSDPCQGFLAGLLESPLDVGKLAYLKSDSRATGLPFGLAVSPQAIFGYMRVVTGDDWKRDGAERGVVGLQEDGISFAENAVLARYWNIQAGYWNRVNRSLQAMVKYVIAALLASKSLFFPSFLSETLYGSQLEALGWLSARFDAAVSAADVDPQSVNPISGLLESRRQAYQRLLTISHQSMYPASRRKDHTIFSKIANRSALRDFEISNLVASTIETVMPELKIHPGEVLVDVPRVNRGDPNGKILVYSDEDEYLEDLFIASPLLSQNKSAYELYVKRMRVFIHPRVATKLGRRMTDARHAVLVALREKLL